VATEIPIAPVSHRLAAVAVPETKPSPCTIFLRMAPPPINPIPVMIPFQLPKRQGAC
jgi:hypothetical protein